MVNGSKYWLWLLYGYWLLVSVQMNCYFDQRLRAINGATSIRHGIVDKIVSIRNK